VIWHALDEVAVGFEGVRVASAGRDIWIVFDGGGRWGDSASRAAYSIAVGWFSRQFPETRKERYAVHEFKLCRQKFFNKRVCS
jgi:serine/threonine protein phosphatase PrpC